VSNFIQTLLDNLAYATHPVQKGSFMFTAKQYRAKAIEYAKLVKIANGQTEAREYQRLERSFAELADNAQWMIDNHGKIAHATPRATVPFASGSVAQINSQQ